MGGECLDRLVPPEDSSAMMSSILFKVLRAVRRLR